MQLRTILFLLLLTPVVSFSQISEKLKGYEKYEGFYNYYYDESEDKIYLEVNSIDTEFLYVYSLSSGMGSNDIGLDRGQLGNEQVVYFKKAGNKLLLVQPNLDYRALTENTLEKKSVEQAFAKSVIYGFPIVETIGSSHFIDLTGFLMQDSHGVSARLKRAGEGSYSVDTSRSAINLERTKAFPENVEFDALLTFKGEPKGRLVRSVTPNPNLITVNQHHSFIKLPDDGYQMREFDPGCGSYPFSYFDYATPVESPIQKRYITRHRLKKKDASAAVSEAVEPIVYYLDNGTPEPVRSALLEGGRWWNQAFEAIGYKDAFQLKMLPDDADPLDVRYNVIQWVHRSTRGWSYGSSITDPRTGEIIKGHVSLGSLRIRQDFMIAQALADKPFETSDTNHQQLLDLALARIRQLSAHEIGHTLGFAHNFAASSTGKTSVMDYPHPDFRLTGGKIDFSQAYETGIGDWDKVTVAYSYSDFPEGTDVGNALNELLNSARAAGLNYISDRDARAQGGAHASAHLWDNGKSASEELDRVLEVRKAAIDQFSPSNIRSDEPYSVLEDVFVPLYFFHRYQTEAAVKMVGGMDYSYAIREDGTQPWEFLPRKDQEKALSSVLVTLDAEQLAIPPRILNWFPPRAIGYSQTRESFKGRTGVSFDALGAAETAADMTLGLLLNPERASRLVNQKGLEPGQLGLEEVLTSLVAETIDNPKKDSYLSSVQQVINFRVLKHIMVLASHAEVHPQVNAAALEAINAQKKSLLKTGGDNALAREMLRRISEFEAHPEKFKPGTAPKIPDGSPIGMACSQE
ncbi:zinc-dependent metalloprotease [Robiginitalea aurantiaca]|uniref:Zinc-dependent metalloprotease n=1 Tax=Robiginitalea aurantiaca TaxID=3056915 RepID=A0ABT7WGC3_9FLAO|nr:zinc-dependent metalloprotease [Robiginitalea aurantiaca]MDM9631869.1 zinc-dependent metalloprotease [Robiginitalea aurantiaca]